MGLCVDGVKIVSLLLRVIQSFDMPKVIDDDGKGLLSAAAQIRSRADRIGIKDEKICMPDGYIGVKIPK